MNEVYTDSGILTADEASVWMWMKENRQDILRSLNTYLYAEYGAESMVDFNLTDPRKIGLAYTTVGENEEVEIQCFLNLLDREYTGCYRTCPGNWTVAECVVFASDDEMLDFIENMDFDGACHDVVAAIEAAEGIEIDM